jgi:acylphosphatase
MAQAHLHVSGFVQGVGYRAFVRSKARKMGLTGWVRNLSDGRVEAVIQGAEEDIKKLISMCKRGSFFAKPNDIVVHWEEIKEQFAEFKKRETV